MGPTIPEVTVAEIVALPALRLTVRAGEHRLENVIEGAHVSEVLHAGELLEGGEFLMTTGSLLGDGDAEWESYVAAVAANGAACLALGIGDQQRHHAVPAALLRAAERHRLPVVEVPESTPFIAVSKAIFAAHSDRDRRVLEESTALQRELTRTAARERGLAGLAAAWRRATGEHVLVLDRRARVLASSLAFSAEVAGVVGEAATDLGVLTTVVTSVATPAGDAVIATVGATRHAGYLARIGHAGEYADLAAPAFLSLLALELERRWLLDEPRRRTRATQLARLLGADDDARAQAQLKSLGLRSDELRAVALRAHSEPQAEEILADLTVALGTPFLRRRERIVEAVTVDDPRDVLASFAPDVPTGIGTVVPPGSAARSMRQAHSALVTSQRTGRLIEYVDGAAHGFLLQVADPDFLRSFSDAVLAPLDAAENSDALIATLHAWFAEERSVAECADRLGVHRHTVRHRLQRIAQLLGRSPETVDAQTELWLALKARGISEDGEAAAGGPVTG
ncbi:MAG: PucR family transcriptional regulator ligand-binding domain-containing protein [Nocardioides sp.]|uniref:PucR family transcriptional regulator n=1 Tax=Nocardioides sp. TaxID=35761 RepID=UPI0039E71BA6